MAFEDAVDKLVSAVSRASDVGVLTHRHADPIRSIRACKASYYGVAPERCDCELNEILNALAYWNGERSPAV